MRAVFKHYYTLVFISFMGISLAVSSVAWVVVFRRFSLQPPVSEPVIALAQQCAKAEWQNGFRHVHLEGDIVIRDITFELTEPCKIQLAADTHLEIINSQLTTAHLFITAADTESSVSVFITDSTLRGPAAGLQVSVRGAGSYIQVSHATLDYAASIGLAVGADDQDQQAGLAVNNSVFYSQDTASEGIVLVSTGRATVNESHFETATPDGVFLLATDCSTHNNLGIVTDCQAQ